MMKHETTRLNRISTLSVVAVVLSLLYAIWIYLAFKSFYRFYIDTLCLELPAVIVLFIVNSIVSIRNKSVLVFLIFVLCVVIPWNIPHSNIVPEDVFFVEHKSEYEEVVELARQNKVEHGGDCQYAYLPPKGYEHLTIQECIFVEYEPALIVQFTPIFSRRLLVYAENYEALQNYISCGGSDGTIGKKVDEHWYICHQDWN